jgi:hypothetical protein
MLRTRLVSYALIGLSTFSARSSVAILEEDFSSDPATHGWHTFGVRSLFNVDSTNQNLRVTWDSSQTNSYFYHSLGTILGKSDDFSLQFDLRLLDINTTTKSGPFQIAVGFMNFGEATNPNLQRGSGVDAMHGPRDIVELDYFPAGYYPDFGDVAPSLSPTMVSGDNIFASGFDLFELTTNDLFHITVAYTGSNQTLHTTITRNGGAFGPIADVSLGTNFTDFRIDTVAVCSYSDFGDAYDSVLAHGVLDNLLITMPAPPVTNVSGNWNAGRWQVQFASQTNWIYTLERTVDVQTWTQLPGSVAGNGATLFLQDTNPPNNGAFYRVSAAKP